MTKEFAWFLGFLSAKGLIEKHQSKLYGIQSQITFSVKLTDTEVLQLIKQIVASNCVIQSQQVYSSSMSRLVITDRPDLVDQYYEINRMIPEIKKNQRHLIRGLFDANGSIHFRKDREKLRISFVHGSLAYLEWVAKQFELELAIPIKDAHWNEKHHAHELIFEGKTACLIAWYLYHGTIDSCVKKSALLYYRQFVVKQKAKDDLQELMFAIGLKKVENMLSMQVSADESLAWCKIIKHIWNEKTVPVPVTKGKTKYFELYFPDR